MQKKMSNRFSNTNQGKEAMSGRKTAILAIALILSGIVLTGYGVISIRKGYESRTWPETRGTIISSHMERRTHRDSQKNKSRLQYIAIIRYSYTVNGRGHVGSKIGFGKSQYISNRSIKVERYLQQFPVGKSVTVYYNPADHGEAVLNPGITGGAFLMLAGGIIFLLGGAAVFYSQKKGRRNPRNPKRPSIEPTSWG